MNFKATGILALIMAFAIVTGCSSDKQEAASSPSAGVTPAAGSAASPASPQGATPAASGKAGTSAETTASAAPTASPSATSAASQKPTPASTASSAGKAGSTKVIDKPESISVLVNKQFSLPSDYEPSDLVYPDVPFTFKEKIEKRKMRKEAAAALEKLFAGADKDGVKLAGVSAYRSYATQKAVFQRYVIKDGEEKAKMYSAVPGTSEHETGLAIDVTGSDGKCAAEDCFGGTKEAKWLEKHAYEYGYIIRYPKGKENITGYQYEPWHIRYIGTAEAKELTDKGLTLEEYLNAVPVSK